MPFTLEKIVPWGRSLAEYRRMFSLTDDDLRCNILACADGPASFNAEATRAGTNVISCDPLYSFTKAEIQGRVEATYSEMLDQTRRNRSQFVWNEFESVTELGQARLTAMRVFLDDYDNGVGEGRYVQAELPVLAFEDGEFHVALCSHFLFLYSEHLSEAFHVDSIREMCRVAQEVRLFPLLALNGAPSPYIESVKQKLQKSKLRVSTERVPYEFVRGACHMMRVWRNSA